MVVYLKMVMIRAGRQHPCSITGEALFFK